MQTIEAFDQLLEPLGPELTPELARALSQLAVTDSIQVKMDDLADKNTEGKLTDNERQQYHSLVTATSFLSVLKARARSLLTKSAGQLS